MSALLIHGTLVHSTSLTNLEILPDTLIHVAPDGTIAGVHRNVPAGPDLDDAAHIAASLGLDPATTTLTRLRHGQLLLPGFVDTHNHAPQWTQRGLGQGMQILDWLDGLTFPNEARFADPAHAARVYARLVDGTLRQGTTTVSYYASLHGEATRILASTCAEKGQRALVGKCNMDRNSPAYYTDASPEASLAATEQCIAHIRALDPAGALLRPVLTPRFAISCTEPLLRALAALAARDPTLPIQTHFNEARQEIDATLALFPAHASEADLYRDLGLLTDRTILAHCTIMTAREADALRDLGCGVAHCPTANMTVGGGFMAAPVRAFLDRGIKVGLGTDSGGGYSSSMLDAIRHALIASFARAAVYPAEQPGSDATDATDSADAAAAALSLEEAFYLATAGGARVVGFGDEIGNFLQGKQFDAIVVDITDARRGINAPLEEGDDARTVFEKYIMTGDDRNVVEVYVRGRKVHSNH